MPLFVNVSLFTLNINQCWATPDYKCGRTWVNMVLFTLNILCTVFIFIIIIFFNATFTSDPKPSVRWLDILFGSIDETKNPLSKELCFTMKCCDCTLTPAQFGDSKVWTDTFYPHSPKSSSLYRVWWRGAVRLLHIGRGFSGPYKAQSHV